MSKVVLPSGSRHGLQVLQKVPDQIVREVSEHVLRALPVGRAANKLLFPEAVVTAWSIGAGSSVSRGELTLAMAVLSALWQQVAFHTLKPEALRRELESLAVSEAKGKLLVAIWTQKAEETLNRLRDISHSGIPELLDVDWSILIERATNYEAKKREIRALLKLQTDQGDKFAKLDFDQLKNLHYTLQAAQKRLDSITK